MDLNAELENAAERAWQEVLDGLPEVRAVVNDYPRGAAAMSELFMVAFGKGVEFAGDYAKRKTGRLSVDESKIGVSYPGSTNAEK